MDFSEEEIRSKALEIQEHIAGDINEEDISEDEPAQESDDVEFKKYVFRIKPEYIEMVESLNYDERNIFLNELLEDYIRQDIEGENAALNAKRMKNFLTYTIFFLVGIPILIWMFGKSLDATHSNYQDMQNKFVKLYSNRGR